MQQNNSILFLTIDLLANNAFNHLKDSEVSSLHHMILKLTEPLTPAQQNLLLSFWNHTSTASLPMSLLHRCNTVLQQLGRSTLQEAEMDVEMC